MVTVDKNCLGKGNGISVLPYKNKYWRGIKFGELPCDRHIKISPIFHQYFFLYRITCDPSRFWWQLLLTLVWQATASIIDFVTQYNRFPTYWKDFLL